MAGLTSYRRVMKTSGITAALPAQDLGRAKAFYVERVGLQALESDFLRARDGQVGLTVGDGVNRLFVYPAQVRSSGEYTQAVIQVTDMRAAGHWPLSAHRPRHADHVDLARRDHPEACTRVCYRARHGGCAGPDVRAELDPRPATAGAPAS